MSNQAEVNRLRAALKAVQYEAHKSLEPPDRNPNRGDLMRVARIASEALKNDA